MPRPVPRLFLIRHGETEWSLNGRHTGRTDIPLTANGEEQVKAIGKALVGEGQYLYGLRFSSPAGIQDLRAALRGSASPLYDHRRRSRVGYGRYEGLTSHQIHEAQPGWDIWTDGCPEGESVAEMQERVDNLIAQVRVWHKDYVETGNHPRDVVVVAHGHFCRVFIARFLNLPLSYGTLFNAEPCGVALLSYNHNNLAEPALTALNLSRAIF